MELPLVARIWSCEKCLFFQIHSTLVACTKITCNLNHFKRLLENIFVSYKFKKKITALLYFCFVFPGPSILPEDWARTQSAQNKSVGRSFVTTWFELWRFNTRVVFATCSPDICGTRALRVKKKFRAAKFDCPEN